MAKSITANATLGGKGVKKTTKAAKPKPTYSGGKGYSTPTATTGSKSGKGYKGGTAAYPTSPVSSGSARSGGSTKTRRPRPKPSTPQERAVARIRRRALEGKALTSSQSKTLRKRPRLEQQIAKARAGEITREAAKPLGFDKAPRVKLDLRLTKQLARGAGEAKLLRNVAHALPKRKRPPQKKIRKVARKVAKPKPRPKARPEQEHRRPKKVTVRVPEGVPDEYKKWVARFGPMLDKPAKSQAGITGTEYLAKTIDFETGGTWDPSIVNPTSGAEGLGQFMEGTARSFEQQYGVDPDNPKDPKSQIKGAAMHLSGKFGHPALYAGYNPGYSSQDPIPSRDVGPNVKVKVPRRSVAAKGAEPKKQKGAWAGSKAKTNEVLKGLVPKSEFKGDKRTPEENSAVGGSESSDHLTTAKEAFAADLEPDDALAKKIAKRLGMASHTGTNEVVKDGYRYQLIWQDAGHYDHIHLGVRWVGGELPPGTSLGGSPGTAAVTTTAPSGTTGIATAATPQKSRAQTKRAKKVKAKKKAEARKRLALSVDLSSPELPALDFTPSETPYTSYIKSRGARVGV